MYHNVDVPFSIHCAPKYKISQIGADPTAISKLTDTGWQPVFTYSTERPPPANTDEVYRVLIEAFRGLRKQYGETLVFSEPEQSTSFIYRSESALEVAGVKERFAWRVHFYQVACKRHNNGYELAPERYGGFVFVRPWSAHIKAASGDKRILAQNHVQVSPAICEGYLRLRVSQRLSPTAIQIARNYSVPYSTDAFDSIPFFSPEIEKGCGYIALAAALVIAGHHRQYTPYELAVVHASICIDAGEKDGLKEFDLCNGKKALCIEKSMLEPIEVPRIIRRLDCPDLHGIHEAIDNSPSVALPKEDLAKEATDEGIDKRAFWEDFTSLLNTYVYQGLPTLFSVDRNRLYSDNLDDPLDEPDTEYEPTKPSDCHLVLIHSLIRGTEGLENQDRSKSVYGISDTRNLHSTGSVFHKMTARRLWAAAARPQKRQRPALQADTESGFCPIAVCVPRDFQLSWSELRVLTHDRIELRDRSQLRGFLISRIFSNEFLGSNAGQMLSEEIRRFREEVRMHKTSRYIWIVERKENDGVFGAIIDTRYKKRKRVIKLILRGVYKYLVKKSKTVVQRLDVWELPCDVNSATSPFRHSSLTNVEGGIPPFREKSDATFDPEQLLNEALKLFPATKNRRVEFADSNDLSSILL